MKIGKEMANKWKRFVKIIKFVTLKAFVSTCYIFVFMYSLYLEMYKF